MKTVRIQTGKFKGKSWNVDFPDDETNFTPAIMKKSIFSRIDSGLKKYETPYSEADFVEGFAGSGQMSMEALGLGMNTVSLFEMDTKRHSYLLNLFQNYLNTVKIYKKDFFRFYKKHIIPGNRYGIIFLDPPYPFWKYRKQELEEMILWIQMQDWSHGGCLFVQTPDFVDWISLPQMKILGGQKLWSGSLGTDNDE